MWCWGRAGLNRVSRPGPAGSIRAVTRTSRFRHISSVEPVRFRFQSNDGSNRFASSVRTTRSSAVLRRGACFAQTPTLQGFETHRPWSCWHRQLLLEKLPGSRACAPSKIDGRRADISIPRCNPYLRMSCSWCLPRLLTLVRTQLGRKWLARKTQFAERERLSIFLSCRPGENGSTCGSNR